MKRKISQILIFSLFIYMLSACGTNVKETTAIEVTESSLVETEITTEEETEAISTDILSEIRLSDDKLMPIDVYLNGIEEARHNPFPIAISTDSDLRYKEVIVHLDEDMTYATYSVINRGYARLYLLDENDSNYKGKVIAVNAGHGTRGGAMQKTFSHPDFTPKVSGGTTKEGSVLSTAVSGGQTLNIGISEAEANLIVAFALRDKLLSSGYSVLMIRENSDCQLDNVARTVLANTYADAHIAIHFDSTNSDKGIFFITPMNVESYLNMEPLKSNADNIRNLGRSVIDAFRILGEKVWKDKGELQGDLTQISYSTNASIDIELGDKATQLTPEKINVYAEGINLGIDNYFGKEPIGD